MFAYLLEGEGFVGWATLFLFGPVTSPEGREGWNLRGVTVINSPFNNSCPTWPASPSQCPLCIYAYVYLCIHSMQEITTAGAQSLFFSCAVGDCTALTLGGRIAHLNLSRNSFNPRVDLLICVSTYINACRHFSFLRDGNTHLIFRGQTSPFSQDLFCDLSRWKCDCDGLPCAKWALNLDDFYILGFIVCVGEVRTFCLLKYDLRHNSE